MSHQDDPLYHPLFVSGHGFPSTWRYLLPKEFADLKLPEERLADCSECPMVGIGEYLPDCRCCTHLPQVPNFQLGLALKDPRTREATMKIIRDGYALPEGIEITPAHYMRSVIAYHKDLFGKSRDIRCPLIDPESGGCAIYAYRSAICSTYYCGHDHCDSGSRYWEQLTDLIGRVETVISQWAMEAVGITLSDYMARRNQLPHHMDELASEEARTWPARARSYLFGDWFGDEVRFFEACAEKVMAARASLWTIACRRPILDAAKYDEALEALAPDSPTDAPEQDDGEEREVSLEAAWTALEEATARLWALPPDGSRLALSQDARLEENTPSDPLSGFYERKPFKLTLSHPRGEKAPTIMFLTETEHNALRSFREPKRLEPSIYREEALAALDDPRGFLAASIRCGVLLPSACS